MTNNLQEKVGNEEVKYDVEDIDEGDGFSLLAIYMQECVRDDNLYLTESKEQNMIRHLYGF